MQTADFYSSATGTLRVNGGRDENAPQGVSLSIDDLSYIKQGSRANGAEPVTDYDLLDNKPQINNITLTGNKSLNDLGIQPKIDSSHKVSADNVDDTDATNKFATAAQLAQITTNKNNISSFHKASGTDVYYQETQPTGTITDGSYWISTSGIKKYTISANMLDYTTVQDHYNIDFSGYPVPYSTSIDDRCTTTTPIDVSETDSITISYSSDDINIIYSLFNGSTLLGRVADNSSPTTISTIGATALYICWYKVNTFIDKSDITNAMVNSGDSALPYVPYGGSWS